VRARGETPEPADGGEPPLTHRTWVYRAIMWFLVTPIYRIVFRARVRGLEHLPRGGALVAANHQSFLDIPLVALALAPRHVSFLARESLARAAWLAWVIRRTGSQLVRPGTPDRVALRRAARHLELGDLVCIFPEGSRTYDGALQAFKKGALLAARMGEADLVPCGIRGSFEAWPRDRRWPRPRRLEIAFGAPIDPSRPDAALRLEREVARLAGLTTPPEQERDAARRPRSLTRPDKP